MKIFGIFITISIFAVASVNSLKISSRIIDGITVDTLKRFPHHVTIHPKQNHESFDNFKVCSGSIINNRWILTSLNCVKQGTEYQIDFKRLYLNDSIESYSVIFDKSSVVSYPTDFDDIALIHLPIILEFNDYVQPVGLHKAKDHSEDGKFAVMAGFGEDKNKLTYGMFETFACNDKYLQLCTKGWGKGNHVPCAGNEGGGLITGWPNSPRLVGIFSNTKYCKAGEPAVFTRVAQYYEWIMYVIGDNDVTTTSPAFDFGI